MGKQYEKKITWTIKNFTSLQTAEICSDQFVVGGCKWHLSAYPEGNSVDNYSSLCLTVADHKSLLHGWRRHARCLLTIVNQNSKKSLHLYEIQHWFDEKSKGWGWPFMLPHNKLHASDGGFLVNDELKIVAEVEVLEVIGKLDVTEETSTVTETMDVNGFQLPPSQGKSVRRIFEKHPEIAFEFLPKNPTLRTGYMSFLLSLIETMCQSPHELSEDDLSSASAALKIMKSAGFDLDWLEEKLDEVSEKKAYEEAIESGLQGMEEELKNLKLRCSDMEALVEKEKEKVSAAKTPLSFDEVI